MPAKLRFTCVDVVRRAPYLRVENRLHPANAVDQDATTSTSRLGFSGATVTRSV